MRLEGQSKLGYYPTPIASLDLIKTWLKQSDVAGLRRYLDPCCGKGEALAALSAAHGPAETYGIEPGKVREATRLRAMGMLYSDLWVNAGKPADSPLLAQEEEALYQSYKALKEAIA